LEKNSPAPCARLQAVWRLIFKGALGGSAVVFSCSALLLDENVVNSRVMSAMQSRGSGLRPKEAVVVAHSVAAPKPEWAVTAFLLLPLLTIAIAARRLSSRFAQSLQ
jgi:hypothetical protein